MYLSISLPFSVIYCVTVIVGLDRRNIGWLHKGRNMEPFFRPLKGVDFLSQYNIMRLSVIGIIREIG